MAEIVEASDTASLQQKLYAGYALMFMIDQILVFKAVKDFGKLGTTKVEGMLYGPQNAFSEDNETNISIIRQRYPSANLIMENLTAGILGRAAQQAGLVSSVMIIVISLVAISSFVIPVKQFLIP